CSGQDYDLVLSILGDPVKGIDKLCMILRRESERSAVTVKFGNQHTIGISRQLQAAIGSEVVMLKSLHKVFLSKLRVGHDGRCSALALNRSPQARASQLAFHHFTSINRGRRTAEQPHPYGSVPPRLA